MKLQQLFSPLWLWLGVALAHVAKYVIFSNPNQQCSGRWLKSKLDQVLTNCSSGWLSDQLSTQWWTPPPTTQWQYPANSYQSVWVTTSTSTVYVYVTQTANAVVTVTSYVPYVITSSIWVFCQGGCPTSSVQQYYPGVVSTVTVTSYAEVTAGVQLQTRTVTSGSYVLAIIEAASSTGTTPSNNGAARSHGGWTPWIVTMIAFSSFGLMIWL